MYKRHAGIESSEEFYLISSNGVMYSIEEPNFESMGSVNSSMVRYVLPDVGYEDATGETHYEIKDHLGNLRVSYTLEWCATCGAACLDQTVEYRIDYVADYFAYGGIMREYIRLNTEQERFLSTGNERDKLTGWDYRNARYYDSDIGRFLGVDPMTSAAFSWSSYRYAFDNPILFIDPSGLFEGWYETIEGALAFNPNINSRDEYEAAIKSEDIINGKRWIGREKVYSVDGIGWMLTADGQAISTENDQWQYFGEAVVRGEKIEKGAQVNEGRIYSSTNIVCQGFNQENVDFSGAVIGGFVTLFGTASHYSDFAKAAGRMSVVGNVVTGLTYSHALVTHQAQPAHHLDAAVTGALIIGGLVSVVIPPIAPYVIGFGFGYGGFRLIGGAVFDDSFNSQFNPTPIIAPPNNIKP